MSPLDFFKGKVKAQIRAAIEKTFADGTFALEADTVAKDGTETPYWFTGKQVRLGENQCVLGVGIDLTERRLAEDRLKASLREKEILLREIHHRVKNNLQLISSILRLQLRQIKSKDEDLIGAFGDIQSRIKAMALVHEALYQSENLEQVEASLYIQKIITSLRASSLRNTENLRVKTDMKDISFGINTAIPCGLIVNELVTNSLKHAFPSGREGEIIVTLESTGEEECQLTVRDNGVGMPQHIDLQHPESLGLDLVASLVRQLDGTAEFATDEGTEFCVRFRGSNSNSGG